MNQVYTIEAIGEFLRTYRGNLQTIVDFDKDFKKKNKSSIPPKYKPGEHWLWDFLADYSVARTLPTDSRGDFVDIFMSWDFLNDCGPESVDELCDEIDNKIGRHLVSLTSKIMMLANPTVIIPFDSRGCEALNYNGSYYQDYFELTNDYMNRRREEFQETINSIDHFIKPLEKDYDISHEQLEKIRINRFMDKVLWVTGK